MTDVPAPKIDLKAVLSGTSPTSAKDDYSEGMSYLQSLPRRLVTLYLPLGDHRHRPLVSVLLDGAHRNQAGRATARSRPVQSVLDRNPTFKHIHKLLFESPYPHWLWNTMMVAVCATTLSILPSVLAAYAIVRLRYPRRAMGGAARSSSPIWCRRGSCTFRSPPSCSSTACSTTPLALILTYPTILIPFWTVC